MALSWPTTLSGDAADDRDDPRSGFGVNTDCDPDVGFDKDASRGVRWRS